MKRPMSEPTPEQIEAGWQATWDNKRAGYDPQSREALAAIYTAMRALERPSDEAVERVARIIDPDDWRNIDAWAGLNPAMVDDRIYEMRDKSFARARAAIAAMQEQSK